MLSLTLNLGLLLRFPPPPRVTPLRLPRAGKLGSGRADHHVENPCHQRAAAILAKRERRWHQELQFPSQASGRLAGEGRARHSCLNPIDNGRRPFSDVNSVSATSNGLSPLGPALRGFLKGK